MARLRTLMALCAALCVSLIFMASPAFAELAPLAAAAPPPAAPSFDVTGLFKALLSGDWISGSYIAVLGGFALLETWMGKTKLIEPNSTLDLVFKLAKGAVLGAIAAMRGTPGGAAVPTATFPASQPGQTTGPNDAGGVIHSE